MRVSVAVLFCLLLLSWTPAVADDKPAPPPKPLTDEQAADAVLAAVKANDDAALKALAEKDKPDPWLVADLLCYRGEHDAAEAFSKAAPRTDVEKLPAYVEAWRKREPDKTERELLAAMNAAIAARALQKVIEGTASLAPELDTVVRIRLLTARGLVLLGLQRWEESEHPLRRAGEAAAALGWLTGAARSFFNAGLGAYRQSTWPRALEFWTRELAFHERRGDKRSAAKSLSNIAGIHHYLGDYAKAKSIYERVLTERVALGDKAPAADTLRSIGIVHFALGDYTKAMLIYERVRAEQDAVGDKAGAAMTLVSIGNVHSTLGDYARALAAYERALTVFAALSDERAMLSTQGNIAGVQFSLGNFARALSIYERALVHLQALGDKSNAAIQLGNIGLVYGELGDHAKALAFHKRALAAKEALGDPAGAAHALWNVGDCHEALGDLAKALAIQERALAAMEALGDKREAAWIRGNLGDVLLKLGEPAKALSYLQQALAAMEALGDKPGVARTRSFLANVQYALGNHREARAMLESSVRLATSLRAGPTLVRALTRLARLHLDAGAPGRALGRAREALTAVEGLLGGLGEEAGATARERHTDLFAVGILASVREGNLPEALRFLESGRAGALLDALGNREALRWKAESLPPELRRLDLEAQAKQSAARHAYDLAVKRGNRKETRAARQALNDATEAVRDVAGRIQRELKQQAGLFYPRAKTIEQIESALQEDQALVLYGLCLDEALALVLRHDGERVVSLGKASEITAACEALDATSTGSDPTAALETLRKLLVEPLTLEADVKQVLVSPEGPLCYLPFGALFRQTIAMTPSGTTHVLLLDEERAKGEGILALGDPDYGGASKGAQAIYYRGRTLSPLPATRKEVETIGTKTLLGAKASEAGFREALPTSKRWRAVHFACHGLVNIDKPMLSLLALSAAGEDDGFLTALEILRTKIPADLAVLSACETGKGKIVKGEGIVGLTRAFMFAGAPRVICSLWKVDDEATQALMIKFYELWNPKAGEGVSAAAALKQAQAFIKGHDKWKHPYYWAAWVLWGLAD